MKKVRLEAETGPNPRDGPRRWYRRHERQAGPRLLSRLGCRRRGSVSHARNVQTFAASSSCAPGRRPVTPRNVTSSPLFSASATTRHRVSLQAPGTAWPASCLNVGYVGEFRDICPEHPRARTAGFSPHAPVRRLVEAGGARRAPLNDPSACFAPARTAPRFVTHSVGVCRCPRPICYEIARFGKAAARAPAVVIQNRTHFVEKYDELAKAASVYRESRFVLQKEPPRRAERPNRLSVASYRVGLSAMTKGMAAIPAANRGFATARAVLP
jgi:hypothetical protein